MGGGQAPSTAAAKVLEAFLLLLPADVNPKDLKDLRLPDKKITELPRQTMFLSHLLRLDLSGNELSSVAPLANLTSLTFLNISKNRVTSIAELSALKKLQVLNVANNLMEELQGIQGSIDSLKALIANDNRLRVEWHDQEAAVVVADFLRKLPKPKANFSLLKQMQRLETIVLSRNPNLLVPPAAGGDATSVAGAALATSAAASGASLAPTPSPHHPLEVFGELAALKKLSLSECGIESLPLRWYLPNVTEVRLARNSIAHFPPAVILKSCQILDVSHNKLTSLYELRRAKFLQQLNISGNPCMEEFPVATAAKSADVVSGELDSGLSLAERKMKKVAAASARWPAGLVLILTSMFPSLRTVDGIPFAHPTPDERKALVAKRRSGVERSDQREGDFKSLSDGATEIIIPANPPAREEAAVRRNSKVSKKEKEAKRGGGGCEVMDRDPSNETQPPLKAARLEGARRAKESESSLSQRAADQRRGEEEDVTRKTKKRSAALEEELPDATYEIQEQPKRPQTVVVRRHIVHGTGGGRQQQAAVASTEDRGSGVLDKLKSMHTTTGW
jgi:Leucine-rich repeat (LRR) protein